MQIGRSKAMERVPCVAALIKACFPYQDGVKGFTMSE